MMEVNYPAAAEIMAEPIPEFDYDVINVMTLWKKTYFDKQWRKANKNEKIMALTVLLKVLEMAYGYKITISAEGRYCYYPKLKMVGIDINNPSILSTLHEFGHHLHGESELEACRFSVHLFKQIFPKQYEKLEWREHTLVRKA
jgi:hypothetical protein